MTRIAACWRNGQLYKLRDVDSRLITADEGRRICADRYRIDPGHPSRPPKPDHLQQPEKSGPGQKEVAKRSGHQPTPTPAYKSRLTS